MPAMLGPHRAATRVGKGMLAKPLAAQENGLERVQRRRSVRRRARGAEIVGEPSQTEGRYAAEHQCQCDRPGGRPLTGFGTMVAHRGSQRWNIDTVAGW